MQERQILYSRKLEKEKKRKDEIELNIQVNINSHLILYYNKSAKSKLSVIRDKTKNGNITKDFDMINQKKIGKVEHALQSGKMKLSVAKTENIAFKRQVENLRKDKLLHLQILHGLVILISIYIFLYIYTIYYIISKQNYKIMYTV